MGPTKKGGSKHTTARLLLNVPDGLYWRMINMTHTTRNLTLTVGMAAAAMLSTAPAAEAAPILKLTRGEVPLFVPDNSALDRNPIAGQITFIGPIGGFQTNVVTGISNSPGSTALGSTLQINSLDVRSLVDFGAVSNELAIELTDTDFTIPFNASSIQSSYGATFVNADPGDRLEFQSYVNDSNTPFGFGMSPGKQIATATGGTLLESFNDDASKDISVTGPYALHNKIFVSLSPQGQLNFSGTTLVVPEPASLALMGAGLALIATARRRRKA